MTVGILPFILFLFPIYKYIKKENKTLFNFIIWGLVSALIIVCIAPCMTGNIGRYLMDFAWVINIISILIIVFIYKKIENNSFEKRIFLDIIFFIVIISCLMQFFLALTGENNIIYRLNINMYYNLKYFFSFWM